MNSRETKKALQEVVAAFEHMDTQERLRTTRHLFAMLDHCISRIRSSLHEDGAATERRKAKRRETEVDAKPPFSPVNVAKPSKPKKPKYSGAAN